MRTICETKQRTFKIRNYTKIKIYYLMATSILLYGSEKKMERPNSWLKQPELPISWRRI